MWWCECWSHFYYVRYVSCCRECRFHVSIHLTLWSGVLPPKSCEITMYRHIGFDLSDPFWNITGISTAVHQCVKFQRDEIVKEMGTLPLTHLHLNKMAAILADDYFKCIFLNENNRIPIPISLKFIPRRPIDNKPTLVEVMAWRRTGDHQCWPSSLTQFIMSNTDMAVKRMHHHAIRAFNMCTYSIDIVSSCHLGSMDKNVTDTSAG